MSRRSVVPSRRRSRLPALAAAVVAALVVGAAGTAGTASAAAPTRPSPSPATAPAPAAVAPAPAPEPGPRTTVTTGVSGQVVDALTGRAVPYAVVTVGGTPVRSDASGTFTVPTGGGAASVRAIAEGYRPAQRSQPVLVRPGAVSGGVVLRLVPRGRLAGTVTDDRGGARVGVTVSVVDRAGSVVTTTATDLRGRWSAVGLLPGTYRVRYSGTATGLLDGWQGGTRPTSLVVTDASRQVVHTALVRTTTLRGTARDRSGRVSPGAVVTVVDSTGRHTVTADAAGRWSLSGIAPGRTAVVVTAASRLPLALTTRTLEAGTTTTVTTTALGAATSRGSGTRPAAATGVVTVRFTDSAGRPVSGLDVMAGCDIDQDSDPGVVQARTDATGRVRLSLPRRQLCAYLASDPRNRFLSVTSTPFVLDAATLDLGTVVLLRPTSLQGRVTTTTGRAVAALVQVTLQSDDGDFGEGLVGVVPTAADGTFTAAGLVRGRYTVEVVPDDPGLVRGFWRRDGPPATTASSADLVTASEGSVASGLLVEVGRAGTVTGRAVDPDGRPVAGVVVVPARGGLVDDERGVSSWTGVPPVAAMTGPDGSYELPQLAPGGYQLVFQGGQGIQLQTSTAVVDGVTVVAGTRRTAPDAVVRPTGALTGRLTGTDGRPVDGGMVAASCEGDRPFSGDVLDLFPDFTAEDGSYRIDGVTGSCVIGVAPDLESPLVWLPDRSSPLDAAPVTVPAGRDTRLDLRVPRVASGSVTGAVTGSAHTAGLTVVLLDRLTGETEATTATDTAGRYRFDRVLPGQHVVAVLGLDAATTFAPSAVRFADAGAVTVDASRTTTADVTVGLAAAFSGTVRATDGGTVLPRLSVHDAVTGEDVDFRLSGTAPYTVTGLAPGRYRVRATSVADARWNDDAERFTDAPALELTAGRTLDGVDFVLDARPDASTGTRLVSGALVLPDGDPGFVWPFVSIVDEGGAFVDRAELSEAGRFTVRLAPGRYRAEWSGSETVPGVSTLFTVSAAGLQRDVVLRPGPAGAVAVQLRSDDDSGALGRVAAVVVDSQGQQQQGFAQNGVITVAGLNRGPAHVFVFAANRWAAGIPVTVGASPVTVTTTVTAAATLAPQLLADLAGVDARIDVLDARGDLVDSGVASAQGGWDFLLLPRQRLQLRVSGPGLETRFWSVDGIGGAPSVFTLQPGRTRSDIVLPVARRTTGARVSGTVTLGGDPVPPAQISLWDPATGFEVGNALTGVNGGFTMPLVPAGRYQLSASLCLSARTGFVDCEDPMTTVAVSVTDGDVSGADLELLPLPAAGAGSIEVASTARVGSAVRATVRGLPAGASATVRWLLDGVPVGWDWTDETNALYPAAGWLGRSVRAVVRIDQPGHRSYRLRSEAVVVAPGQLRAPVPVLRGTAAVGSRLTTATSGWLPDTTALTVRWRRDGALIGGATGISYLLTPADRGHRITVTVTGSAPGYTAVARTSAPSAVVR